VETTHKRTDEHERLLMPSVNINRAIM